MRVKTEEKRRAILEVAREVFREKGYAAASMAEMSARLGGSKGTLYSYFSSKEDLFTAVMLERAGTLATPVFEILEREPNVERALREFMRRVIELHASAEVVDFRRIIIAEGFRTELGKLFYEHGPRTEWQKFTDYFTAKMDEGVFRRADAEQATAYLEALCTAGPIQRLLEGAIDHVSAEQIEQMTDAAMDVFFRAYGAEPSSGARSVRYAAGRKARGARRKSKSAGPAR
jgi:AcrR family transcriptional regulator